MSEEGKLSEKREQDRDSGYLQTDLFAFHEQNAGRLIVDPECVFLFLWQNAFEAYDTTQRSKGRTG